MAQIIGYRKDRLGARIIALGNLLSLEDRFGASVEHIWPDGFESHDMAIEGTEFPVFDPEFQAKYLTQISQEDKPSTDHLTDLSSIRSRIGTNQFDERLNSGERFLCNEGLHAALFSNDHVENTMMQFRDSLARIVWSKRVQEVLAAADEKLSALPATPLALHVRRGDVLDKMPWCHKNWVSKFAPDEFYFAVMDRPKTGTVLFSDTPIVVERMSSTRQNTVTLNELVDAPDLSEMQRDLVELVLMSRCTGIVAPSLSAFSSSAAMMGGMGVTSLPRGLPEDERIKASDTLLDRVLGGPATFHNTGDFAQSLGYAFRHALKTAQHRKLHSLLREKMAEGQDYAFYLPLAIALALACGDDEYARKLHIRAQKDENLWLDDKMICDALGTVAQYQEDKPAATKEFLEQFLARRKSVLDLDSIASYFLKVEPSVKDLFMVDDPTRNALQLRRIFLFPDDPEILDGAMIFAYPFWLISSDWSELFDSDRVLKNAAKDPTFAQKRGSFPLDLRQAEMAFHQGKSELPTDEESLMLLSALGVAFSLSGRHRRALSVFFHCRNHDKGNPIHAKRLANHFMVIGDDERAMRNLKLAQENAPRHPGIAIAAAKLLQKEEKHGQAAAALSAVADQNFLPINFFKTWELSLRKLKSRDMSKEVIAEAAKRFPNHKIFEKQWKDKL